MYGIVVYIVFLRFNEYGINRKPTSCRLKNPAIGIIHVFNSTTLYLSLLYLLFIGISVLDSYYFHRQL